jgi:hypothetical protein
MEQIQDWRGNSIEVARSVGGVLAIADPWRNLISSGIKPWPVPELIQKIYQSRQSRAFKGPEYEAVITTTGFYSDLQSIHGEDAITWSFFGPVAYAAQSTRETFVKELLHFIDIQGSCSNAIIWLWRRLPHPDTLVLGGPEIDFGIQTEDVFLLGEAKWRSSVGARQGKNRDKDQMTLRREFCQKYGSKLLRNTRRFVILGVSWDGGLAPTADSETEGVTLHVRDTTWKALSRVSSHPCAEEVQKYLLWKVQNSKAR